MTGAFPPDIRSQEMAKIPGWFFDDGRNALFRRFLFADFSEAFAFMTRVAMASEEACHHPEWTNVFNRLDIWLTTHDAGGVTSRDIALAQSLDAIAAHGGAIQRDTDDA